MREKAARQGHGKRYTTQLIDLASQVNPAALERINPHALPPWRTSIRDWGQRLSVTPPAEKKKDAAKAHNRLFDSHRYNPDAILVYSDGSMTEVDGK